MEYDSLTLDSIDIKREAINDAFEMKGSWPISRVLSWTIIRLGLQLLTGSSNLPGFNASRALTSKSSETLFGLAPGGVYPATNCYQSPGALLPHPFSLTCAPSINRKRHRRSSLCCTCRGLAPPRCYLAPCSLEPGLSSPLNLMLTQRLPDQLPARIIRQAFKNS